MIAKACKGAAFADIAVVNAERFADRTGLFGPDVAKAGKPALIPSVNPEVELGE